MRFSKACATFAVISLALVSCTPDSALPSLPTVPEPVSTTSSPASTTTAPPASTSTDPQLSESISCSDLEPGWFLPIVVEGFGAEGELCFGASQTPSLLVAVRSKELTPEQRQEFLAEISQYEDEVPERFPEWEEHWDELLAAETMFDLLLVGLIVNNDLKPEQMMIVDETAASYSSEHVSGGLAVSDTHFVTWGAASLEMSDTGISKDEAAAITEALREHLLGKVIR